MQLLQNGKQQFIDQNGAPLANGTVYFYAPGTTNPMPTYQDLAGSILNTNPVLLDSRGQAVIWGSGTYRQIVKDCNGVTIWDQITCDSNAGLVGNITDAKFVAGTDFTPGTTTTLTLPCQPSSASNTWVFFDAAFQADDQYTVSGSTLTFVSPIPGGVNEVNVKIGSTVAIGVPSDGSVGASKIAPNAVGDKQLAWGSLLERSVDSISALKMLKSSIYKRAVVCGYYAPGDGGGGLYYVDASDTTTADNGGTVIVGLDGARWKLSHSGLLSVKQFGAKCDGTTNDSAALAAFIAATGATDAKYLPSASGALSQNLFSNGSAITDLVATSLGGGPLAGDYHNPIINGAFDRWSLGSSFTLGAHLQPLADGWNFDFNGMLGAMTFQRYQISPNFYAPNFQPRYGARITCSSAGSGNTFMDLSSQIEGVRTLMGQQVTISLYAFSLSGTPPALTAIKTEQYFGSGGTPSASLFNTSNPIQLSSVMTRYDYTCTLAQPSVLTLGTNADDTLNVIITLPLNQTFDIVVSHVQINPGPVAMPYKFDDPAIVAAKSARRVQSSYDDGVLPGTVTSNGSVSFVASAANPTFTIPCAVAFRTPPAATFYNPRTGAAGSWDNQGVAVTASVNTNGMKNVTVQLSGCTVGSVVTGHYVFVDPAV